MLLKVTNFEGTYLRTRVLDKHIHPAHTFYDIVLQVTQYALNEKHNEYA